MGYEALFIAGKQVAGRARAAGAEAETLFVSLLVDVGSNCGFRSSIDGGSSASECLSARLLARLLDLTTEQVHEQNGDRLTGLTVYRVLEAMTSRAARHAADSSGAELVIGLHLNEYQIYKDKAMMATHDFVKKMLSEVTNYVKDVKLREPLGVKVSLVPVVSGMPYRGLDVLWTEWLQPVLLPVPVLNHKEALDMVVDIFSRQPPFSKLQVQVREELESSSEAEQVLMASCYRPRLVEELAESVRDQAARDLELLGIRGAVRAVNWQSAADGLRLSIPKPSMPTGATRVARAALLQIPMRFVLEPGSALSAVEQDVQYAESRGENELVDAMDEALIPPLESPANFRMVRMPFMQLLMWGGKGILPPAVYEVGRFRWADVEQELYVAHLLAARLAHWANEIRSRPGLQSVHLGDLFPGALGSAALRATGCVPGGRCEVYPEPNHGVFLANRQTKPDKSLHAVARRYKTEKYAHRILTDGIFLTATLCFLVDTRLSVPLAGAAKAKAHLLGQAKQSQVDRAISVYFITQFVADGHAATQKWATEGDRVIFFIVTNRPLTRGIKKSIQSVRFFKSYSDLLLSSKNEISYLLRPGLLRCAV